MKEFLAKSWWTFLMATLIQTLTLADPHDAYPDLSRPSWCPTRSEDRCAGELPYMYVRKCQRKMSVDCLRECPGRICPDTGRRSQTIAISIFLAKHYNKCFSQFLATAMMMYHEANLKTILISTGLCQNSPLQHNNPQN